LGATLQYSGWHSKLNKVVEVPSAATRHISGIALLDNHQVNLLSSIITSVATAIVCSVTMA